MRRRAPVAPDAGDLRRAHGEAVVVAVPVVEVRDVERVVAQPVEVLRGQRAVEEHVGAEVEDGVVVALRGAPHARHGGERVELAHEVADGGELVSVVVDGGGGRGALVLKRLARLYRQPVAVQELLLHGARR